MDPQAKQSPPDKLLTLGACLDYANRVLWDKQKNGERTYSRAARFVGFMGGNTDPSTIVQADVDLFVVVLDTERLSGATINRHMAAISSLIRVASEGGAVFRATLKLRLRRESPGRTRYLGATETIALSERMRLLNKTAYDLFIFLLETGLRLGEALELTREDLDLDRATVFVRDSKNGKPRGVPMTTAASASLFDGLKANVKKPFGNRITARTFQLLFAAAKSQVSHLADDPEVTPHILRHTCASRLVEKNVPLRVVQEWLGHKSIKTTERYAHVRSAQLEAARDLLQAKPPDPR